jgi:hypothetical protein
MRKLLLQLDTSFHPSVFDRVVAFDAGADDVMSYGGVNEDTVRDLVHGAIFTRGPKDLHHTAIFIGGTDMAAGERLLAAVRKAFFGPMRVSVMLDSNGSNTTAVAAVSKLQQAVDAQGRRAVVTAGTGPVGARAAGLLAMSGADVTITSRAPAEPPRRASGGDSAVRCLADVRPSRAGGRAGGAELLLKQGSGVSACPARLRGAAWCLAAPTSTPSRRPAWKGSTFAMTAPSGTVRSCSARSASAA